MLIAAFGICRIKAVNSPRYSPLAPSSMKTSRSVCQNRLYRPLSSLSRVRATSDNKNTSYTITGSTATVEASQHDTALCISVLLS